MQWGVLYPQHRRNFKSSLTSLPGLRLQNIINKRLLLLVPICDVQTWKRNSWTKVQYKSKKQHGTIKHSELRLRHIHRTLPQHTLENVVVVSSFSRIFICSQYAILGTAADNVLIINAIRTPLLCRLLFISQTNYHCHCLAYYEPYIGRHSWDNSVCHFFDQGDRSQQGAATYGRGSWPEMGEFEYANFSSKRCAIIPLTTAERSTGYHN